MGSLTFLVVEEDGPTRSLLVEGLSEHGEVDSVGTLAAAKLSCRARAYDALLLDAHLPDGSGLELLDLARERSPGLYVVVLAASADQEAVERAFEVGAGFLLQPCQPKHLALVAEAARSRRSAADRRTRLALQRWAREHSLSSNEIALLELGMKGIPRREFSARRRVQPDTIRKQIQLMLEKTGNETFELAVTNVLREALAEPT